MTKNLIEKNSLKDFQKTKIIALEIISRHKRGEIIKKRKKKNEEILDFRNSYKVFIRYVPYLNEAISIKSNLMCVIYI